MMATDPPEMVLRTLLNLQFLQCVDEAYERGDSDARRVVDDFFLHMFLDCPSMKQVLPFVDLKTVLPMLAVPLCYAAKQPSELWDKLGWTVQTCYDVAVECDSESSIPTIDRLLSTTALCAVVATIESGLFGGQVAGLVVLNDVGGEFNERERAAAQERCAADGVQGAGDLFESDLRIFPPAAGRSARR